MDIMETHYKVNVYFLSAVGLWPYTSKRIRQIQTIVVSIVLWTGVIAQLLTFVTVQYTLDLFLKNVPNIIVTMSYILKYNSLSFQMETVKYLMEQMKCDWNSLYANEAELAIIKKRIQMGKYYTQTFAMLVYSSLLIVVLIQLFPEFVNVVIPLNQSQPHKIIFMTELFFDQQKYFYHSVFLTSTIVFVGSTTFSAAEGILFVWMQHIASMFEIVSYRIKETVTPNPTKTEHYNGESDVRTFAKAMEAHKRASKFCQYAKRKLIPWYLFLTMLGVLALSIYLVRFSQLLESLTDISALLVTGIFIMCVFTYMLYCNYVIQQVLDTSHQIFRESYNNKWYEAPVDIQKQLLFVMSSNFEDIDFNMYGLFKVSIEGFGTLVKISVSYFMVLHSIQ